MNLYLFIAIHMIFVCRCRLLDTFNAPVVDSQNAPLTATINTSSISNAIVRSLESPIEKLITSSVNKSIELNMDDRIRDAENRVKAFSNSELKLLRETVQKKENEIKEINKKLEILQVANDQIKQKVDCLGDVSKPTDCVYIDKKKGSGIYNIFLGNSCFQVFCDMETDGGGWTVFQRRIDGSTDFYRGWSEYENGFGDLQKEFWLGNSNLHSITSQGKYELRIDLDDFENNTRFAKYTTFSVGGKDTNYRLTVDGYNGDAGDSLSYHNGAAFSTKDRDNDGDSGNCAQQYKGGWWYFDCHHSNLNGLYLKGKHSSHADGINWLHWKGYKYSLKSTTMMTRKVK